MNNTILNLDIYDTHNLKTVSVLDISVYDPKLIISNPSLEITPPGFSKISVVFAPNSLNTYNSNNIGLTTACDYDNLVVLPDGIWTLKYSINPNVTLFIEKSYLRTANISCRYQKAFLDFIMKDRDIISKEANRRKLRDVSLLIDGAISAANLDQPDNAMELYNQASKVLDHLYQSDCKNCNY